MSQRIRSRTSLAVLTTFLLAAAFLAHHPRTPTAQRASPALLFFSSNTDEGLSLRESVIRGCEIRFRPIIVSAIVAVIGFLPAALSHGIGAEIQRPLARVVIGGLLSSTPLTLLVLPAIYAILARRQERTRTHLSSLETP